MNILNLWKFISGNANDEERSQVVKWVQENEKNKKEYMSYRKLYDIALSNGQALDGFTRPSIRRKVSFEIIKIAAVVAIVLGGVHLWTNRDALSRQTLTQTIETPAGQRTKILLSDGSVVWLNARSRLTFPENFNKDTRDVELNGEGYFQIAKNKKKPFIVHTDNYNVKALGTEFNVIAYSKSKSWSTSLINGSVEIASNKHAERILLLPNTTAYLKDDRLYEETITDTDYFRWRDGLICFHNISIEELTDKLNLYYGYDIILKNKSITKNRYSGKFRFSDGIEHALKVLQLDNDFHFKIDNEKNLITII